MSFFSISIFISKKQEKPFWINLILTNKKFEYSKYENYKEIN